LQRYRERKRGATTSDCDIVEKKPVQDIAIKKRGGEKEDVKDWGKNKKEVQNITGAGKDSLKTLYSHPEDKKSFTERRGERVKRRSLIT